MTLFGGSGSLDDGRPAAPEQARLLAADRLAVVAEDLGMVDVDAGEDDAVGVEDVDRVAAAAQTHLENDQPRAPSLASKRAMASSVNSK